MFGSRGILLYCFYNDSIDYALLTRFCVSRIRQWLPHVQIALISDIWELNDCVDFWIQGENEQHNLRNWSDGTTTNFRNLRLDCFDKSPFNHTLLMDIDYIVNSHDLSALFNDSIKFPSLAMGKNAHVIGKSVKLDNRMNIFDFRFSWTTLVAFSKNAENKLFFDFIKEIHTNQKDYYSFWYVNSDLWRNDFAFSIAARALELDLKPVVDSIVCFTNDQYLNSCDPIVIDDKLAISDVHFMEKRQLLSLINEF